MILPLAESLAVAYDWAPRQTRTPLLKKGFNQLSRLIQTGVTSYYFEWHLQKASVFDTLFLITRKESMDFLTRLKRVRTLSGQPIWNSIIRFISAWNSGNPALAASIPHIWLAFDYSEVTGTFNPPNAHFCIDRNFSLRNDSPSYLNRLSRKKFRTVITQLLPRFVATDTQDILEQAEHCFSFLPPDGEVIHLSAMHSRDPWTLKFNMTMPKPAFLPFLKKVQWPGDVSMAAAVLDDFCPNEKRVKFNILMNKTILNKLEVELEYNTPLTTDPRRERALELLRRRGCASKSACDAVMQWPGYDWQPVKNGNWPAKIKKWLDLKICLDESDKMTAKAYLGFYPFYSIV